MTGQPLDKSKSYEGKNGGKLYPFKSKADDKIYNEIIAMFDEEILFEEMRDRLVEEYKIDPRTAVNWIFAAQKKELHDNRS